MDEKTQKPVTGSNEHHAEIERRLAAAESNISSLQSSVSSQSSLISSLQGTVSTLQTTVNNLQSEQVSIKQTLAHLVAGRGESQG